MKAEQPSPASPQTIFGRCALPVVALLLGASSPAFADPASGDAGAPSPLASRPAADQAPAVAAEEAPYDPALHDGWSEGAWLRATRGYERRSTPMMVTGIVLVTLGASLVTAGAAVGASGSSCSGQTITTSGEQRTICGAMTAPTVGAVLGAAGLITLAVGIPLTAFGAAGVPRQEAGRCHGCRPDAFSCSRGPTSGWHAAFSCSGWQAAFAVLEPSVLLGLRTASFAIKF